MTSNRLTPAEQALIRAAREYIGAKEAAGVQSHRQYNRLVQAVAAQGREQAETKGAA